MHNASASVLELKNGHGKVMRFCPVRRRPGMSHNDLNEMQPEGDQSDLGDVPERNVHSSAFNSEGSEPPQKVPATIPKFSVNVPKKPTFLSKAPSQSKQGYLFILIILIYIKFSSSTDQIRICAMHASWPAEIHKMLP